MHFVTTPQQGIPANDYPFHSERSEEPALRLRYRQTVQLFVTLSPPARRQLEKPTIRIFFRHCHAV
jgi:hypothetical protein